MKEIGADIGFSAVKCLTDENKVLFPSVVGNELDGKTFSMRNDAQIVEFDSKVFPIGNTALLHSNYSSGSRAADWVVGDSWKALFIGSLAEVCFLPYQEVTVVTGLPMSDWEALEVPLYDAYKGTELRFKRFGRNWQTVVIKNFSVITQGFGALLSHVLDDAGNIVTSPLSVGVTAVCGIGGNTVNLLVTDRLTTIKRFSESDEFGLLYALDDMRDDLRADFPRIRPETHEVSEWVAANSFVYNGEKVDLSPYIERHLHPVVDALKRKLEGKWTESGRFNAVLFTDGGSIVLRPVIEKRMADIFPVMRFGGSRFDVARGYLRYAKSIGK